MEQIAVQCEFLLRIIVAGVCGAIIGYERKSRLKEAGIRTHFIVALASSLLMIVSKYGFYDILGDPVRLDPSRIASCIVTGVGFLGAGAIFIRKQTINGLTTAAGIWATAGVGMAIGAGMYFLGISGALIILFVQILLHKNSWITRNIPVSEQVKITAVNSPECVGAITGILYQNNIEVLEIKTETADDGNVLIMNMNIKVPYSFEPMQIANLFAGNSNIRSIDI